MAHEFHPTLLREYDIRGIVGKTLGEADAYAIGRSFATVVRRAGGSRVAVGYDGRLSSVSFEAELVRGLIAGSVDVLRIGLGPTPMLYYAEAESAVDGGVQVTGSHNPADHNGFKFVLQHRPFFGKAIAALGMISAAGDWTEGAGRVESIDLIDRYVARLMEGFDGAAFRIGWDAGNGATGPVIEKLVKLLPGEHHTLFTQIDGHFPHHHPDPTIEENLTDLRTLVLTKRLHFGVAFDGDGDRIGVVDGMGRVIWGDQLLGLFAETVLKERPGATIVADVKASQALFDRISVLGGKPLMWKTGHSLIKAKMKEVGSPLGGEMTGHVFFADDYYGFDDGLYAAIRLIRAATSLGKSVTELKSGMVELANTPEIHVLVEESRKFRVVEEIADRLRREGAAVDETDGVRVARADGWWLLRASNTQAALVVRAEGSDESCLKHMLQEIESRLADSGIISALADERSTGE